MANPPSSRNRGGPDRAERIQLLGKEEFGVIFERWRQAIREAIEGKDGSGNQWALVGIKRRGAVLARRLWKTLSVGRALLHGEIDISLYRDDYHLQTEKAMVLGTEISFRVDGVNILLVDDVLYTGRTVRAAMDLLLDFGRPRLISLAVLIDRGHRELPIAANFVGKVVATEPQDRVLVKLAEMGEEDSVEVLRKAPARGGKGSEEARAAGEPKGSRSTRRGGS
ncbi:MAG TPA: bifunctional pyr operon transcriptional regulator/uracil phosphoribosyltransferase PyrR [Planctomycetota bacterium]|nr:bifunctional pyr operon transcriptional regulator/uracil phosphoribosyltransferase PyrR [Planctomycetota bacterium]